MTTLQQLTRKEQVLNDHRIELAHALKLKEEGVETVTASMAGPILACGRSEVPLDEYIAMWQHGIAAVNAGADPANFNY